MLILHLSDIHFRSPQCLRPDTDPDRPFRTRMLQDIRSQVQKLGAVHAILIGGDIAFKAAKDEYDAAMTWIEDLLKISQCPIARVYVIPGNHDIDRGIVAKTLSVKNAQAAIVSASPDRREATLREQFEDVETGGALLKPMAAYNDFAKYFGCQIYSPDHLYWKQDLELDGGVRLRLHGLTSTILSGRNGADDAKGKLYLSPLQTGLDPEDNVVNLVIVHHPPDWCLDTDVIEDDFNDRAAIHLFGHKHRQRVSRDNRYIRIGAPAVNPDRYENGFEPGYNLIDVSVSGTGAERRLKIEAHLRYLQRNPEQFICRLDGQDSIYRHQISIPDQTVTENAIDWAMAPAELKVAMSMPSLHVPPSSAVDTEAAMSDEPTRNLVFRFWKLNMSGRREIAQKLKLLEKNEMSLPEPERYGRALLRAGERDLLVSLAAEVEKMEKK